MLKQKEHFHGSDLEKIEKIYGIRKEDIISFSANVNPLGISFRLRETLAKHLDAITSYPDREYTSLRKCIGAYIGADFNHILVGNGSTELISLFIQSKHPNKALIVGPTYSDYEREVSLGGGRCHYFSLAEENDFVLDIHALMEELEELPVSSIIHVSLSAREEKPVSDVIAAPVQVNWVEIYSEDGEIRGGLTIRKSILGEGERDRVEMTDEEIKQEYLGNLEYLLSQPKLLNALGLRMGSEGRYFQAPTTVEPIKNLLDQTAKQAVLTTKNYCISGKKQGILDYLNTVDYTSVMVDRVRLSILER